MAFPPGSSIDTDGRLLASKMSEGLGQPIVSDNRVGAGGMIGASIVAKAPADGYTILFATPSTHVIALYLSKNLPYDPIKDFTPIAAAIDTYQSLAVSAVGPVNSLQELLQYAKRNPGKLSFSSAGMGTQFHLAGEIFKAAAGVDILHVPYKSAALALPDLVSGVISMTFSTVQAQLPLYRGGKVKIVGIMNPKRYPGLPDVPAIAELVPGYERPYDWMGFFGPGDMPRPIVQRLNAEVRAALAAPDVARTLDEAAQMPIGGSAEDFAAIIKRSMEVTERQVKAAGLKPE